MIQAQPEGASKQLAVVVQPAMAAGVTSKLWEMANMVAVLEEWEAAN